MGRLRNKRKWNIVGFLLVSCLLWTLAPNTSEASSVADLKAKQEKAKEEAKALEDAKASLEGQLGDLNSDLWTASANLTEVENEIASLQVEIDNTTELMDATTEIANQQYENMKKRIQYIYESGEKDIWELLLTAGSFSEFVNRVEYTADLNRYDRAMMDSYQQNLADLASYKEELSARKADLDAKQSELAASQEALQSRIASVSDSLSGTSTALSDKNDEVADYDSKIKAMEEFERKQKEEQARRDAARLAQIKAQEEALAAGGVSGPVTTVEGDEYLLASIIYCEAGSESYEGKLAVGSVIINRVNSTAFPNTIQGVVYQSGQFSPAMSGRLALAMEMGKATDDCYAAAIEVLAGNVTLNCLYFCVNNGSIDGIVIDHQVFY